MSTNQNTPGRDAEGPAFGHAFRSESVAREMRSCQVNRLAIDGLPWVRGRRPALVPDAAVQARAITDYSDGVRLAVEQGRRMAVMLAQLSTRELTMAGLIGAAIGAGLVWVAVQLA